MGHSRILNIVSIGLVTILIVAAVLLMPSANSGAHVLAGGVITAAGFLMFFAFIGRRPLSLWSTEQKTEFPSVPDQDASPVVTRKTGGDTQHAAQSQQQTAFAFLENY